MEGAVPLSPGSFRRASASRSSLGLGETGQGSTGGCPDAKWPPLRAVEGCHW